MKKTGVVLLVLLLTCATLFANGTQDKSEGNKNSDGTAEIVMKFGHVDPSDGVTHIVAMKFAEVVQAETNGRVRVDIYPSSQLGGPRDMIEGLEIGTTHIVAEPFMRLQAYDSSANVANVPFLVRDREHAENVWNGEVGQELFSVLAEKSGIMVLCNLWRGARIITSTCPIDSLEDLDGLKIRVPPNPFQIDLWKNLGASPTPLEFNELFMALKQGVVEAQENPVMLSYGANLQEVCKYWIITNLSKTMNSFLMSEAYFGGLDSEVQAALRKAGVVAAQLHGDLVDQKIDDILKEIQTQGVTVIYPEDMAPWEAKLDGFIDNYPEFIPWADKIIAVE